MEGFDQTIETDTITTVSKSLHSSSIENGDEQNEVYPFHAERDGDVRWSAVKNNPSVGLTCWNLLSLLWRERRSIDWMRYIHRILGLMCVSMLNSMLAFLEGLYVNIWLNWTGVIKLADSIPSRPPVFILGHPRTGTTLLHSLMALDSERFYFCNTFQAGFPTCFLFFENLGKRLFAGVLSETRPMDKMKLHFDLPQEDELATCLLTGFRCSPYLSLYFPRNEREFREYQSFRNASRNDVDTWTKAFLKLVNKLKIRDILKLRNEGCDLLKSRQLLLKSPCHTARVRLLLKLFPNAKFVYIHRNPYEVFLSSAHMASTTYGYCFLQKPSDSDLQEYILRQGEILIGEYLSCIDDSTLNETVSKTTSITVIIKYFLSLYDILSSIHS